jgi:hypothetical protein
VTEKTSVDHRSLFDAVSGMVTSASAEIDDVIDHLRDAFRRSGNHPVKDRIFDRIVALGELQLDMKKLADDIGRGRIARTMDQTPKVAGPPAVTLVSGESCRWKRDKKVPGGLGGANSRDERFRGWSLQGKTGSHILLHHTHDLPMYVTPKGPPEWRVQLRFPSTQEERDGGTYGTSRDFFLKRRFPSPNGDEEGLQEAMQAGVHAWNKMYAERMAPKEK